MAREKKVKAAEAPTPKGRPAKSTWSGMLSFGVISIPVELFTGAREIDMPFHHYHRKCNGRVKQLGFFCGPCEGLTEKSKPEAVKAKLFELGSKALGKIRLQDADIFRGYEFKDGKVVEVTDAEIDAMKPESAKVMEILEFVPSKQVDPIYFETSFYMAPDPDAGGQRGFALLREAMVDRGVVGLAKLTKSMRENLAIIIPHRDGGMMMYTAYMSDEIRSMTFPALPENNPKELKVACDLVDALTGDWNPAQYKDTYRENVNKMLEAKRSEQPAPKVEHKAAVSAGPDVMASFVASLELAKQKRANRKTA
jgi:DNA end-binding protein Ku